MADLTAKIDRARKTAEFFGPGTFAAKETIKQLGPARWRGDKKVWEVSPFTLSNEELDQRLPNISIQETVLEALEDEPENKSELTEKGVPEGVSVSEFIARAKTVLRGAFPGTLFIYGVLSSVKTASDGRVYMELAEQERPQETVSCVIWRDAKGVCKKLFDAGFQLEKDLQVMFEVNVDLNPRRTQVSLGVVRVVAEYTLAKLAAQREITNERLRKEKLFEENKKKKLPFLPKRFGILTSAGGTVINDFRSSLDEARFGFELFWLPVNVQGADAKKQLLRGIAALGKMQGLDAVLIFRGGGSPAELAVFNDYDIAKSVCLCPVPVISAIGHQEDQSSVQDVSALFFGVPKDIGHFLAERVIQYRADFSNWLRMIVAASSAKLGHSEQALSLFSLSLVKSMSQVFVSKIEMLEKMESSLLALAVASVSSVRRRLMDIATPLAALSRAVHEQRAIGVKARADRIVDLLNMKARTGVQVLAVIGPRLEGAVERVLDREDMRTEIFSDLVSEARRRIERALDGLISSERLIKSSGPEAQLKRGFSLVRRAGGNEFVTSGKNIKKSDKVDIEFHDKTHRAEIQ